MVSVPHKGPPGSGAKVTSEPVEFSLSEDPGAGVFVLPGGFISDDGVVHRQAVMRPLTGFDEEWLTTMLPSAFAVRVVTGLLTRCLVRLGSICPVPRSVVGGLLVSDREYLIMKLREMTFGARVDSIIRCSNEACGKPMQVSFNLGDDLVEQEPLNQRFFNKRVTSRTDVEADFDVEFHLPTGDDQEALAPEFARNATAAVNQLLSRCVSRIGTGTEPHDPEIFSLPDDVKRELSMEMERLAPPLVGEFDATCPECGFICSSTLDFNTFFLAEMKSSLPHLERDIHMLAWNYHWTEREVLSLPRKKRQRYVEMVNEELDRRIGIA